jgi:hypothetical protein
MRAFLALLPVIAFFAEAEIITTSKIEDIEKEFAKANNETFVIFDYDDVLLENRKRPCFFRAVSCPCVF